MTAKREAKKLAEVQRRNGAVRERLCAKLGLSIGDARNIECKLDGSLVVHPGIWLSLDAAEKVADLLEKNA